MLIRITSLLLLLGVLLCGCVRTGEKDSLDFVADMAKLGYECIIEETESGGEVKESCYVGNCKISLFSDGNFKLYRLCVTYSGRGNADFASISKAAVISMCGCSEPQARTVLETLGVLPAPPDSTMGVARCETDRFFFSFTCDTAGGMLCVDNIYLNPTQAPTVTVRTTVPSPEEAETVL